MVAFSEQPPMDLWRHGAVAWLWEAPAVLGERWQVKGLDSRQRGSRHEPESFEETVAHVWRSLEETVAHRERRFLEMSLAEGI